MPSRALQEWRTTQRAELDQLDAVVRGVRVSERVLRQQLVDAYILLLAAQFQLYCRNLHGEAAGIATGHVQPARVREIMMGLFVGRRQLDRGNAHPAALTADFRLLDVDLWPELVQRDRRNHQRQRRLEQLNLWRNAIAHQSFQLTPGNTATAADSDRTLRWARVWRTNCSALAHQMDTIVRVSLTNLFGTRPW
jgi:hypothetical protein